MLRHCFKRGVCEVDAMGPPISYPGPLLTFTISEGFLINKKKIIKKLIEDGFYYGMVGCANVVVDEAIPSDPSLLHHASACVDCFNATSPIYPHSLPLFLKCIFVFFPLFFLRHLAHFRALLLQCRGRLHSTVTRPGRRSGSVGT